MGRMDSVIMLIRILSKPVAMLETKKWVMMVISPFVVGLKKIDSWKDSDKKSLCKHWGSLIVFAPIRIKKGSFKRLFKSFVGILSKVTNNKHFSIWPQSIKFKNALAAQSRCTYTSTKLLGYTLHAAVDEQSVVMDRIFLSMSQYFHFFSG